MKGTMLVVEDEEPIQELIQEYLKPLNIKIYFASTGEEGVEMYKKLRKQGIKPVVIMDLKLPGISGAEATKRIKRFDKDAEIYAFTAWFKTKLAEDAVKAGAKAVIGRYVGFDGFRNIVSDIFAGRSISGTI